MLDTARQIVADARSIVCFSGAGLSAESGVPTFRDAATSGFWIEYDPQKLASPQGFESDPGLVYRWYNDRRVGIAKVDPNPAHMALAKREDITNVTQNIDNLLQRAGAKSVIQLHGTLDQDHCNAGACRYTERIDITDPPDLRRCPMCGEWLRPSVVWFGEMLPTHAWMQAEAACSACDVLLVVGTAAEVYPAAGLIDIARHDGATIIVVNTNPSGASYLADVELIGPAGELLPQII
jgi:NAD-dependent deacetylase